jgi:dTDP-4-amino-4,6-dideoxygalactose transaminase
MSVPRIPFNRPLFLERGLDHVRQAYADRHVSGDGRFSRSCQQFLEQTLGVPKVLLTTSCTDALEMCALLLDLQAGDEVIVPSFTFVSSANAFVLRGAKPVFVDIRPDTFNLDERALAGAITSRTKAIVVVHYAGIACAMDLICGLAKKHSIPVIEDNAHGLFGAYHGRPLGAWGELSTCSFHETKNLSCGEGGAIALNSPDWIARAEILREKGTDRSRFFRGEIDKYSWVDVGSSFLPSDILAAILWSQMERSKEIQARRQQLFHRYIEGLATWATTNAVQLPHLPAHCDPSYHLFAALLPTAQTQANLISHLKQRGVDALFHYQPLHLSTMGRRYGGYPGQCPVTESVAARLVRLPLYFDLQDTEQQRIIDTVCGYKF